MTTELFLRYIHFISIIIIAGTLAAEYVLLKEKMTRTEISRLAKIDAVYGIASLTLVAAGLTLWLGSIGKPAAFYNRNWIFFLKLGLFATVGILSIYPTVFFIKRRKGDADELVTIPVTLHRMIRIELALLLLIPLLAGLMSRGIGIK